MSPTIKNNILTWAVVVLIAANIIVIALFWMGHHKLQQQQLHETPAAFLARELSLDDKQKLQLHELASQHHAASDKIRGNIKDARDRFFDLIKQNVSSATKDSAAAVIAENLRQLELLTFDHFQSVRKICTPEQQVRFDRIIDEVLKMVAGPHNGGPPEAGSHNGPPPPDHPQPEGP